jgi:antitoxin ParD1/3/4
MASMNVSVPDPMREWVQNRIESGKYASVSDYVRDLIRHDQQADAAPQLSVSDVRQSIEESRAMGGTVPADDVFARLEAKLNAIAG